MSKIKAFRTQLEHRKGELHQLQKSIVQCKRKIKALSKDLRDHEQAREVIREVGLKTQQQLQYHISDITSLALESVFPDPYQMVVEFVEKRNKTECDLYFMRDGKRINPMSASGGGAVDIGSFALRVASFSMKRPNPRRVIIMDEPMRFLSAEYQEKASQMIKEISEKMNLQFIIVTHNPVLAAFADKSFRVIKKGKYSIVKTL